MPSMPQFLQRITNDNQLKNIIANVFTETNKHNQHTRNRTVSAMHINSINTKHSVPIPNFSANKDIKKNNEVDDVQGLHERIQNLESALHSYQQIIKENRKTTHVLKETIAKIQAQKDEATRKINALRDNSDKEEVEMLKNKNAELQELSTALAQNLARKQKSLEEALNAMHSLHETKQKISTREPKRRLTDNDSKSLTDNDILSLSHSNVLESDEDDDNEESVVLFRPQSLDSSGSDDDERPMVIHSSLFSSKGMAQRIKSMSKSWGKSSK